MDYYTITEASKILGIHERNIRDLIRQNQLQTKEIGNKIKISKESMDNLIPGFRDDPNPDVQTKEQFNPNLWNDVSRKFDEHRKSFHPHQSKNY